MDCYRRVSLSHVARRFDTTLDKFRNSDKNLSVGLLSKHLIGNLVGNEAFEGYAIVIKMSLMIDNKFVVLY